MGRDPKKDELAASEQNQRETQETDQVLATSKRLIEELKALIANSQRLISEHEAILESRRREAAKRKK